jgi:hypothetical protein
MYMSQTLTFRLPKYHHPFDDSDNPCCWQVDRVVEEVESILKARGVEATGISDDWGFSFIWKDREGVEHDLMIECTDVETAEYTFDCLAQRRFWFIFSQTVLLNDSDFAWLIPEIRRLAS